MKPSERIAAVQVLPQLEAQLRGELRAEGIDPDQAAFVEDDSDMLDENGEIRETGHVDDKGEMRRPWCAATRILEHRESVGGGGRGRGKGGQRMADNYPGTQDTEWAGYKVGVWMVGLGRGG